MIEIWGQVVWSAKDYRAGWLRTGRRGLSDRVGCVATIQGSEED